jgi:putative ATP-dependent endonuclease of OLD family
VIEDPEAQLHPMTLAAVLTLIGHISWQKIVTTQSGEVLAAEPLSSLRRLTRSAGVMREWRVRPRSLSAEDLRRVGYHLRARRGAASFARCWLLVEGETEFWVLPELARIAGHDFAVEGVACVEFAQCGLRPLIKLARELGIEWHVLTDGDKAGQQYVEQARRFVREEDEARRITALDQRDIENCFYAHGYASVFHRLAGAGAELMPAGQVIHRAIDRHSKPMLALELVLAASARKARAVPAPLARMIETCVALARSTFQAGQTAQSG